MLIVILFNIPFAAKFQKLNLAKTDFSCAPHTIQERTSRHFEKPDAWNMWRQSIRCERPAFSVCSGDQMSLRRIVPKRLIQYEFSRDSIHSFCFSLSLSLCSPLLHVLQIFPLFFLFTFGPVTVYVRKTVEFRRRARSEQATNGNFVLYFFPTTIFVSLAKFEATRHGKNRW